MSDDEEDNTPAPSGFDPQFRAANLADSNDRTFIRSTWARTFKKSHDAGMIHTDDWAAIMHRQIDRVLDREGSRAIVCYEKDSPSFLYGWIAGDTSGPMPVVFFAFVKAPFQKLTIGRQLLAKLGVDSTRRFEYSCRTTATLFLRDKIPLARYNPLEVRYPKGTRRDPWPRR